MFRELLGTTCKHDCRGVEQLEEVGSVEGIPMMNVQQLQVLTIKTQRDVCEYISRGKRVKERDRERESI